jgi:hypothetical protein
MAVTWTSTLPQCQPIGISAQGAPNIIRSETDSGPAKARRRFTAVAENVDIPMLFTAAQKATFDAFWDTCWDQAGDEAGTFEWRDVFTDSTVIYRFRGTGKPAFRLTHASTEPTTTRWETTLQLETLPSA